MLWGGMLVPKIRMSIPISQDVVSPQGVIPCTDPATHESLGSIPIDAPDAVHAAVDRARAAHLQWKKTSLKERARVLRLLLNYTVQHKDDICRAVQRDSGKTRENALVGEIWPACEKFRWMIKNGPKHLKPEKMSSGLLIHKRARLEFHPLGVVAAIIPWNYPFQNVANPIIPALMAGNAVVLKPSEWVSWSSRQFIDGFRHVLSDAGYDPNLIQGVYGYGETGAALARAAVDTILFIGSVGNGRRVLEASAERIVPVVMELGGKDAFVVCDDADLEQAVHASLAGCFINAGQNCVAAERLLVHKDIYDAFEMRVGELVQAFRQGPGRDELADIGAIVTPVQLDLIQNAVDRALTQGARLVTGGKRVLSELGNYYQPTILADVTPDMDIANEEIFGPIMLLIRTEDDAHAITVANGVPYGLGSSVFSKDHARAQRIAQSLDAGMTAINDFGGITYMAQDLTFGGVKASGFGRMNGRDGLRSMCNVKAVMDDRFPIHKPNVIFPVKERDYGTFSGVIDLIYSSTWKDRLNALKRLLGL